MASIGGIDLGDIQNEDQVKDSGLFQTPLPRQDSDGAILSDLFGVFRTVTIQGTITGTKTVQNTFITNIETITNGTQSGSTFVSSIRADNITVLIQSFRWVKRAAVETKLEYTLTLLQGNVS